MTAQAAPARGIQSALSDRALIAVSGSDAGSFLDAQFTQRVSDLEPGSARLAAWCSPQGRVLVLYTVLRSATGYWLCGPADLLPPMLKRLRLFVLRSKVALDVAGPEVGIYGLVGAAPAPLVPPDEAPSVATGLLPGQPVRQLWVVEGSSLPAALAAAEEGSLEDWQLAQIAAGLPDISARTSDHWLPQSLDLEALGGLSYQKGCYPGQEIVARVHYRGTVKQRLASYVSPAPTAGLPPGSPLKDDTGAVCGEVLQSAWDPRQALTRCLLVLDTGRLGTGVQTAEGTTLLPANNPG